MLGAMRFLWNATRGYRLRPWRSEYLKWRLETYSGMKAETIGLREFCRFAWQEKKQLFSFLKWTDQMRIYARAAAAQHSAVLGPDSPD